MPLDADPTAIQRQARALGDPTRHEIFRRIDEAASPIGVRELSDGLGLHPSAIRQHLAKLLGADLVEEVRTAPEGPGRPRSLFRRRPGVLGVWRSENPFERLAALLIDAVRLGTDPRAAGRDAGRNVGESLRRTRPDQDALALLAELVAAQGFEPSVEDGAAEPRLVLGHCPYASLAAIAPEIVCELHHGLAEGMAEGLGDTTDAVEVTGLRRRDPVQAGCRVELRRR